MKWIFLALFLTSCTVVERGEVTPFVCPDCTHMYDNFETCAFFDVDNEFAKHHMLVDHKNHHNIGIPVRVSGYMHHKFCYNDTHAIAGSANPTKNGLQKNDNFAVLFESKQLAKNFETEYEFLQGKRSGKHKKTWTFNNQKITHLFCPRDNCEKAMLKELSQARHSIRFMTFTFTSDKIGEILREKHRQGINVQGIMEPFQKNVRGSEYAALKNADIPITLATTKGLMHHKVFVIDNNTAIFGSYNPTKNANTKNAETILITQERAIIDALNKEFTKLQK